MCEGAPPSPYHHEPQNVHGVCSDEQLVVQDAEGKQREKAERLRFGRFFYRFPNGESGYALR